MGIKRIVDTSFWTDGKVDDFSPEDKYFMLYLMTNPFTTQLGIYEISVKQVAFQMGYSVEAVRVLLDRFENKYGVILFSEATNEIAIKNFLRHSIIKGGAPVRDCLIKEIKKVKNRALVSAVFAHVKQYEGVNETVHKIIAEYEEKNGALHYSNEKKNDNANENENENENDVSYHDTPTNRSKRETAPTLLARLLPDYILSPSLQEKMGEWVKYKTERKEPYKEQGMKSLLRQVERQAKAHGDHAVCNLIDECMASNWKGIIFDRLNQKPAKQYQKQTKADELNDFYGMAADWAAGD